MSKFLNDLPKNIFKGALPLIDSNSLQGANFHGPKFILFGNPLATNEKIMQQEV